jgi:hypothetical protein
VDYKPLSLWNLKISFTTILLGVSLFANSVALYRKPISPSISDGTTTRRVPLRLLPSSYSSEVWTIYLSYETPMTYVGTCDRCPEIFDLTAEDGTAGCCIVNDHVDLTMTPGAGEHLAPNCVKRCLPTSRLQDDNII